MKFKIFSLILTLTIISVMPLIYMGKFDPVGMIDSAFDTAKSEAGSLRDKVPSNITSVVTDKKVQVYKWRDANGVMQFSNTPPPDSTAEQVSLDPNTNLMQAVKVEEKKPEQAQVVQAPGVSPYSPKQMKKVLEDAKGVEALLQQRHEDQQKMLSNF